MALPFRSSVRAGDWVAISGQLGLTAGGLAEGFDAQAESALANFVGELARHGLSPRHVVKTTVFLTDGSSYGAMNATYTAVFQDEPPARSAIIVRDLPLGGLIEIEGWAYVPSV
ncbi:RidA family protein [Pseudofrankia sp. BMG5.37]|uniref:RidA family protein n=1 Tax=Pseudofrankia sp. BMG5.37 TaxID=3050035 RepID=UPI0009F2A314|nr:RidA family protein [Pseudofrankia sp. BMG5.37]